MDQLVMYGTDDKIGIVTLNRPSKLNAINAELRAQLVDALRTADADPSTSVVILRAEGRSFCASFDVGGGEAEIRFSDVGPAVVMPYIIGLKKARELLYFGDTIDAETALRSAW
jgi:enoyl-CoA hydratase/carnithine racemase